MPTLAIPVRARFIIDLPLDSKRGSRQRPYEVNVPVNSTRVSITRPVQPREWFDPPCSPEWGTVSHAPNWFEGKEESGPFRKSKIQGRNLAPSAAGPFVWTAHQVHGHRRFTLAASSRPPPPTRAMNSRRLRVKHGDFLPDALSAPPTGPCAQSSAPSAC